MTIDTTKTKNGDKMVSNDYYSRKNKAKVELANILIDNINLEWNVYDLVTKIAVKYNVSENILINYIKEWIRINYLDLGEHKLTDKYNLVPPRNIRTGLSKVQDIKATTKLESEREKSKNSKLTKKEKQILGIK